MPKKNRTEIMVDAASTQIVKAVADLLIEHEARIAEAIEDSEGRKLNVSFSAKIDFSESVGTVDTYIGYSQVTKDKRHADIDPPDQMQIPGTEREPQADVFPKDENVDEDGRPMDLPNVVALKPKRAKKKKSE